ncbi:cryptochrome/photolyase family protein [Antarcticimicrobium sediminis]|uniref:Deoxyribodipyrimidine photo-lyase n=1 Tax=Antarcticimicrobium sediminis TaxID=2546227 RepID=A0A4R5ELA4_9RHOB|nr:deoxyribodipyrimidine photo-lyase [Antarcticimicrobium sediminis]TDE35063.1 deoxyribodipyrimidine photo-lyase [Antarcticimicrobium sediminis]
MMRSDDRPVILWLRRDLRLTDHPALTAACAGGRPVIPVFILDDQVAALGAAAQWRLGQGLEVFARTLADRGSRLILRRGPAQEVLQALIAESGAGAVHWTRAYDPISRERDGAIKSALKAQGIDARSFPGSLLFEPWTVQTGTGGPYRVFTPMWKTVRGRDVAPPLPAPGRICAPEAWPVSDRLQDWALGTAMRRGAAVLAAHSAPGEAAAQDRLARFIDEGIARYEQRRDIPGVEGTSGLSEYLALGEIAPQRCWHAAFAARERGGAGAETFFKELVWREFAYHLMYHSPQILTGNWRSEWDDFPWNTDRSDPRVIAWTRGRTGMPFVDAAMREMYVTGRMHNRGRMIVASYLTKHLMTHWRIGMDWFAEHLTDWDPASNAMGWQWSAGSGPDATPYFRVFNPESQLAKFDRDGSYRRAWIAEGQVSPPDTALDYFRAIPLCWGLAPGDPYPAPIVSAQEGRRLALEAYQNRSVAGAHDGKT